MKKLIVICLVVCFVGFSVSTRGDTYGFDDHFVDEFSEPVLNTRNTDPWMPMNRVFFKFNDYVYVSVIRPTTRVYQFLFPTRVRKHVKQVVQTVSMPVDIANYVLQGRVSMAAQQTGRLLVNATVGIGGIFDVADPWLGWSYQPTGFGATLGRWGVPKGPYLVLPFLGPTTLRNSANVPFSIYATRLYLKDDALNTTLFGGRSVTMFETLVNGYNAIYMNSLDAYSVVREWQLNRGE
jgi:phospholipid-binding lipoprotein MlaA